MGRKKLGVRRITIKLNLHPVRDADLIALLLEAPSRSGLVKERLRARPQVQAAQPEQGSESAGGIDEQAPAVRTLEQFTF